MFQQFSEKSDPSAGKARVSALRARMEEQGLDAFLVPHADEHQNEYLPERAERLAWLTGFTGSAGAAIILKDAAHVFTDGRYTLQVRSQTDPEIFTPQDMIATPPINGWPKTLNPACASASIPGCTPSPRQNGLPMPVAERMPNWLPFPAIRSTHPQ
jgi:Xaa-Pro aminopeptidase